MNQVPTTSQNCSPTLSSYPHCFIQQRQWQDEDLQSTKNLLKNDSTLPLVWLATENGDIPPGAVPFREDSDGPLYIARAIVEGESHLGMAGTNFPDGARISYQGEYCTIRVYEVLACASDLRWGIPTFTPYSIEYGNGILTRQRHQHVDIETELFVEDLPRVIAHTDKEETQRLVPTLRLNEREHVQLKYFAKSKCVVVVDDSLSMLSWWPQVRDALSGIADLVDQQEWAGVDLMFIHEESSHDNVKTRDCFEAIFSSVIPCKEDKNMAPKVTHVLDQCMQLVEDESTATSVVVLLFTNGPPTDRDEVLDKIIAMSRTLNSKNVARNMLHVHLLQVGDDRTVIRALQELDDKVAEQDHGRGILNTVTFHRARGLLGASNIMEILIRDTEIPPEADPDATPKLPDHIVQARKSVIDKMRRLRMGQD